MELYTALGRYIKQGNQMILLKKTDSFSVQPCEYILWKTLLWNVSGEEVMKEKYEQEIEKLKICPEFGFHYYFARLINMELIGKGVGDDMGLALMDLMKDLYPKEIEIHPWSKVKVAASVMTKYKIPPAIIKKAFKKPLLDDNEKEVLSVIKKYPLDTKTMLDAFDHLTVPEKAPELRLLVLHSLIQLYVKHRMIVFE